MAEQKPAGVYTGGISSRDRDESDAKTLQRLENRLYVESKDLNYKSRLLRYRDTYGSKFKVVNGKAVRWDTRLNKPYDPKNAIKFANLNAYQTTTPRKDVEFLRASEALRIRRAQGVDPISKFFSKKLVEGSEYGTVAEAELAAKLDEREKGVNKLRIGSSYEIAPDAGDAMDGGGPLPLGNGLVSSSAQPPVIKTDGNQGNGSSSSVKSLKIEQPTGPTANDAKAAGGLQAWYRGGPRTLKQAEADSAAYFQKSGWDKALKGVGKRDMKDIAKAFRGGYATVFTNKGGKDFLHYKGRVYSKPTQGG